MQKIYFILGLCKIPCLAPLPGRCELVQSGKSTGILIQARKIFRAIMLFPTWIKTFPCVCYADVHSLSTKSLIKIWKANMDNGKQQILDNKISSFA